MLTLNQFAVDHGGKLLFKDVQLNLVPTERYGIVGANGSGKSSLLRVLGGIDSSSQGTMGVAKRLTIGLLKQDQFRYENDRVVDVVIQGKTALWAAMQEKEALLAKTHLTDQDNLHFAKLEETIAHYDGYSAESYAQYLLTGLEIKPEYHHGPLKCPLRRLQIARVTRTSIISSTRYYVTR